MTDGADSAAEPKRTSDEIQCEIDALNQAHLENETTRDAFLALAHTALFAASVSFVGDLAGNNPRILWVLIVGWSASVVGLCALTISYFEATRHIRRRQAQVYQPITDEPRIANGLNGVALWSFPLALISTFAFAAVNIADMSEDRPQPPPSPAVPFTRGVTPPPRAPSPFNPQTGVIPAPRAPAAPPSAPPPPPPPSKD